MSVYSPTRALSPGPGMERRSDRTADTRRRIERAALKLFVEKGIGETSIRDISREAQISLGAMYNHFKTKDELAWQLFINGWNEIGTELERRSQGESNLSTKFRSMIEYVFRRFDEDWLHVTYIFGSRHQHLNIDSVRREDPKASVRRGFDRYRAEVGTDPYLTFRQVIRDAMQRDEIPRGDLELKTALIVGGIIQTVDSRILVRLKGPLADSAAAAADLCVRMLSG
jgi:AcrR family transcriptional regulator